MLNVIKKLQKHLKNNNFNMKNNTHVKNLKRPLMTNDFLRLKLHAGKLERMIK